MATISLTDSIFTKLNDEELLLINELYLEMKKYKNIIEELEEYINSTKNWYINLDDKLMEKPYIFVKDLKNKLKELKEGNND